MTPAEKRASDRGRAFSDSWGVVRRVQGYLERLARPSTTRTDRLVLWRLVSDAALEAWQREVEQLDSLNAIHADPQLEVPVV